MTAFANNVHEVTQSIGTGDLALEGPRAGKRSYQQAYGNGPVLVPYTARQGGDLECGWTIFQGPATVKRDAATKLIYSTNGVPGNYAFVDFQDGDKDVFVGFPTEATELLTKVFYVGEFTFNAGVLSASPNLPVPAWEDGVTLIGWMESTNPGALQVNPSGNGNKSVRLTGNELVGGEIQAKKLVALVYFAEDDYCHLVQMEVRTELSAAIVLSGIISPAQLIADVNNWSPTGLSTASAIRIDMNANRTVTGLAGGRAGRILRLKNVSDFTLTIAGESVASAEANRFASSLTIGPMQSVLIEYDGTDGRWSQIAAEPAGSIVDSTVATYTANADLTSIIPYDDSLPQITEGTQIISLTHTMKSATNKLRVRVKGSFTLSGIVGVFAGFHNTTADAVGVTGVFPAGSASPTDFGFEFEISPNSASQQTISLRVGTASAGMMRLNGTTSARRFGGGSRTIMIAEEIKG